MFNQEASTLTNRALSQPTVSKMVNSGLGSTPVVSSTSTTTTTTTTNVNNVPVKKSSLKLILGGIILALLVVGSGAALYLSQVDQDVRQRATGCTYWSGGAATEGACDNRGGIMQECKGGYWSAPSAGKCGSTGTGGTGTGGTGTGTVDGAGCVNNTCTSPDGGCIAIHHCDQISNGECTVLTPDVTTGIVNAQEEANESCQCVQVDVLNGGSGSCTNGHINGDWSTLIGASVVCPDSSANCGGTDTPPGDDDTPETSPEPSPSPITYFCNSDCTTDRQCKTADSDFFCSANKCRLASNPGSTQCHPVTGPMCLDVAMVDALNGSELTADPKMNDTIKFACANVEGVDHYAFRVIEPGGAVKVLTATGRVSEPYTISKSGKFYAQCQICSGADELSCNAFEALD